MATELANFPRRTQEIIHEWANIVRTKYAITEDEEDVLHMGDPLLIIEWDENGLQQRGIQKTAIINAIRGVQGCQLFPQNAQLPSDSIFYIVDTPNIQAQQIVENIAYTLRGTYAQRGVPTLGRVYVVVAERKGAFKVTEKRGVF
ncbi:32171_t:CDS:2 [Gigaspora margarita]|uniref:32171_t:CDS:1 n=1 Tax=Gigaspora margarita TaxID=4874 RepID=A0ABN7WKT6_GIGMA|nr:32171_t:CDS:2 [Gigaspora margarita]